MERTIEYIGEVLPDGHLSMPEDVRQTLAALPHAQIQVTIKVHHPTEGQTQEAWAAFRQLGHDAPQGRLQDASTQHDRYLYRKKG